MEKLSKIACYLGWNRGGEERQHLTAGPPTSGRSSPAKESPSAASDVDASTQLFNVLESILLWENSVNSISVVIVFNILFWGIVVSEVRGFAAASSAVLVVVLSYSTLEAQVKSQRENKKSPDAIITPRKVDQFNKIVNKAKSTLETLKLLRKNQPGVFCAGICAVSIGLWLVGSAVNGVLLTYAVCMSILVGPVVMLQVPCKVFSPKDLCKEYAVEWESEIEEFLPAVTEDNLEVLERAGDTGEHSPTSHSVHSADNQIDPFNEDELVGLKMPSHDDGGSTDGLDVSELELSTGDTEVDAIKMQSEHFEQQQQQQQQQQHHHHQPDSSSEDDGDLEPMSRKLPSASDESDSEFEIIDSHEIDHLNDA